MAEVRQIPSAVGAFEAQVFDMGKTYKTIMTQAAAQAKAKKDAKKELDKMMANTYAAKGKGRLQDMPELEKQYNELQNYYIANNSAILKGGKEYMEFQKKRSDFIFEAEQANLRKERDKQLSPFFKLKIEKEGLSDKSKELMTIFNLPYNDPRRKEYTYEGSDGQMHSIDELNVTDIDKYTRFNEIDLIKDITTSATAKNVSDLRIEPSAEFKLPQGYQIAVTDTVSLRDPVKIAQIVTGRLISQPDARNYYKKLYESKSPEALQEASRDFDMFNNIYKAAGYGQIINYDNDGIKGISSPEEFAIYRNLKANLPQELGEKISTSLMTAEIAKESLDLKKRQFGAYLTKMEQAMPIDTAASVFLNKIGEGPLTPQKISDLRAHAKGETAMMGNPIPGSGGLIPGFVDYIAPGEKEPERTSAVGRLTPNRQNEMGELGYYIYTTQRYVTETKVGPDGKEVTNYIEDMNTARKLGGDAVSYGRDKSNRVFIKESVRVPVDNRVVSPVVRAANIKTSYGKMQEAQQSKVFFDMNQRRLQGGAGWQPVGEDVFTGKRGYSSARFTTGIYD